MKGLDVYKLLWKLTVNESVLFLKQIDLYLIINNFRSCRLIGERGSITTNMPCDDTINSKDYTELVYYINRISMVWNAFGNL